MSNSGPRPFFFVQLNPFLLLLFKHDMQFITMYFCENNAKLLRGQAEKS